MADVRGFGGSRTDFDLNRTVHSTSTSGDTTVISAPGASTKIIVWAYTMQAGGTQTGAQLTDGAAGTALTNDWALNDREGVVQGPGAVPLFECSGNTALTLNLTDAVATTVDVTYETLPT